MDEELRFSKIDDAIQRLAVVASDLSKMLAVHEQRIANQEKTSDGILNSIEKRREEIDNRLRDVYTTIRDEIHELKEASTKQHDVQNNKISKLEKMVWTASGGAIVVGWIVSWFLNKVVQIGH